MFNYDLKRKKCIHKKLFDPIIQMEIIGSLILVLIIGLSNAGGVEGGFLIIPFVYWIFNYTI